MKNRILFNSRDEMLRIEVDKIVYFESNGNYTHVVSRNKLKATLTMSLTKTEQVLTQQLGEKASKFMRVGKRFIVNLNNVYSINLAKQYLVLTDQEHFAYQLPISKEALRKMKELIVQTKI